MAKVAKRKAPNAQRTKTYAQLLALAVRSERRHMRDQRKIIALERKILALEKKTQRREEASVGDFGERMRRARNRMIKPA